MEKDILLNGRTVEFIAPSGFSYTLREQNGEDDDVLSHTGDAKSLMNISKFISTIVVGTDATKSGKLSPEEAHLLPTLDRFAILIKSRIHSLGENLEFSYPWPKEEGGPKEYEVDLNEYLHDYSKPITQEHWDAKPEAIPAYPLGKNTTGVELELESGKLVKYNLLNGQTEADMVNIPENEKTKNTELRVRDLHLMSDGKWIKVSRFHLFSPRDMQQIRISVKESDPAFFAKTEVENPSTGQVVNINLMSLPDFFYLGEM